MIKEKEGKNYIFFLVITLKPYFVSLSHEERRSQHENKEIFKGQVKNTVFIFFHIYLIHLWFNIWNLTYYGSCYNGYSKFNHISIETLVNISFFHFIQEVFVCLFILFWGAHNMSECPVHSERISLKKPTV